MSCIPSDNTVPLGLHDLLNFVTDFSEWYSGFTDGDGIVHRLFGSRKEVKRLLVHFADGVRRVHITVETYDGSVKSESE